MSQTVEPISERPQSTSTAGWMVAGLIAATVSLAAVAGTPTAIKSGFLIKNALHLSASQASTIGIITGIPAYLRPLMGAVADLYPIFGFHRKSYYVLGWLLSAVGSIALGLVHSYNIDIVVAMSIIGGAGSNLLMVMQDAVMVAVGNKTGNIGRYQSLQQFLQFFLAAVVLSRLGGILAERWSYQRCFLISGLISLLGVLIVWLIPEKRAASTADDNSDPARNAERAEARNTEHVKTKIALLEAARTPSLWVMLVYVFYLILTPGSATAQFYFTTTVLHFSPGFIGITGAWGSGGAALGALLFALTSRRLPVRSMVWGAFLMDCSCYPLNLLLHNHFTGILIALIAGVTGMVYTLCLYTLAARSCPPGVEGSVYGLMISATYLAGALGDKLGSSIYDHFGPATHHSITYGWHALNLIGFAFTVLAVIFIPFLPAWSKSNEPLNPKSNGDLTATA